MPHQHVNSVFLIELLLLFDNLGIQLSLALNFTLEDASLLLSLLLELSQVVLVGLSLRVFIQLRNHLVVVLTLPLVVGLLNKVLVDDSDELLVAAVEGLRGDVGHLRLVEEQPVGVLALKNREIAVEEGTVGLKHFLTGDFLLDVVGGVDQVVEHLLLDELGAVVFTLSDDLLDFGVRRETRPQDELLLAEHQKLSQETHDVNSSIQKRTC